MAGNIPRDFIDQLVQRADIVDVIGARVALKKAGRDYKGLCPFHREKTPSFTVNRQKQVYYCFGCSAGGNVLSFVMEHDKLDFVTSVESLAASLSLEVPREGGRATAPPLLPMYELLERGCRFYEDRLRRPPESARAVEYLKGRGLSGATAKAFRLGYAPSGRDVLRRALCDGDGGYRPETLADCGLLRRDSDSDGGERLRDHLWNRVVFPIRDLRGRVLGFGARALADDVQPKYLNSPESKLFQKRRVLYGLHENLRAHRRLSRLLLVEGYMDVITLFQYGVPGAVATLGTALSEEHLELAFRHVRELVFCFDGDEAGRRAAARALATTLPAMRDGRQVHFLFLPESHDPDSWVREIGAEAFTEQLESEQCPLSRFLLDQLSDGLDLKTPDGRASFWQRAQQQLSQLPATMFRELLLREIAPVVGIELEELRAFLPTEPAATAWSTSSAGLAYERPPPEAYQDDAAASRNSAVAPAELERAHTHTPERDLLLCLCGEPALAQSPSADVLLQALEERRKEPLEHVLIKAIGGLRKRPGDNKGWLLGWLQGSRDMARTQDPGLMRQIQQYCVGASPTRKSLESAFEKGVELVVQAAEAAAEAIARGERDTQLAQRITAQLVAGQKPTPEDSAALADNLRVAFSFARRGRVSG